VKSVPHSLSFQRKEFEAISCSTITAKEYFSYQHVETVATFALSGYNSTFIPEARNFVLPARRKTLRYPVINKQRLMIR
jgi:hypothetical protein